MSLAEHVRILGRGPGRARSLTQGEARDAMGLMLSGQAAPEAIGALLMLLRMKGEEAEEIAGFAEAAQAGIAPLGPVDLDWPSYAAGRTRGLPWFVLSARLVAAAGHRVLLHGWNGEDGAVRAGLAAAGIPVLDAGGMAGGQRIGYLPLDRLSPPLFALLNLREVLGLRSCVNTVCRMLNPGRARASVQGVFHPSYRALQSDAACLLGWEALSVIKGGGGEFEVNPSKDIAAVGLRGGAPWSATQAATTPDPRRLADAGDIALLGAVWRGAVQAPAFAEDIVIATAALALDTLGDPAPETRARALWQDRFGLLAPEALPEAVA